MCEKCKVIRANLKLAMEQDDLQGMHQICDAIKQDVFKLIGWGMEEGIHPAVLGTALGWFYHAFMASAITDGDISEEDFKKFDVRLRQQVSSSTVGIRIRNAKMISFDELPDEVKEAVTDIIKNATQPPKGMIH